MMNGPPPPASRGPAESAVRVEGVLLWTAAIAQTVLRILYTFNHRADADEPQHLHVVWGWTQGLVQYRDTFDNHAPLFHLVMAPLIGLLGERADLLILARWLVFPLAAVSLWATYEIGRLVWSRRVGYWGALMAGFVPTFLLTSTEFRTDVLWMTGWLLTLVVLLRGTFTSGRAVFAGLLLGATLAVSLKTVPLILALSMAGAITAILFSGSTSRAFVARSWRPVVLLIAGCLVVPLLLLAVFWRLNALDSLVYCTIQHNLVPRVGLWNQTPYRMLIFPAGVLALVGVAFRLSRDPSSGVSARQICVVLTAGLYLALLESFWPLITKQDFLPSTPLVALAVVAGVQWALARLERARPLLVAARAGVFALAAMCAIDIFAVCRTQVPWRNWNQAEDQILRETLRATRPGEPIMDIQGETVFRPRPFYYILENLTEARLADGLLSDHIARDIIRTRTHFAAADSKYFPLLGRRFLNEHFLKFGVLRVLGTKLENGGDSSDVERTFHVCYPERFAIVATGAPAAGMLDGARYLAPIQLSAGVHRYRPGQGERNDAVVWATAIERNLLDSTWVGSAQ